MHRYCYTLDMRRSIRGSFDLDTVREWIRHGHKYEHKETLHAEDIPVASIVAAHMVDMETTEALEFLEAFDVVQKRRLCLAMELYVDGYASRKDYFFQAVYPYMAKMPFGDVWRLMKNLFRPVIQVSPGWRGRSRFHVTHDVFVDSRSDGAQGRQGLSERVERTLDAEARQEKLEHDVERSPVMEARRKRINVAMEYILTARDALNRANQEAIRVLDRHAGHTSVLDRDNDHLLHRTLDVTFQRMIRQEPSHDDILESLSKCTRHVDFDLLHLIDPEKYHAVIAARKRLVSCVTALRAAHEFRDDESDKIRAIVAFHQTSYETQREKLLEQTKNRINGQRLRKMRQEQEREAKRVRES